MIKKIGFIVLASILVIGCGKKQEALTDEQAMMQDGVTVITSEAPAAVEETPLVTITPAEVLVPEVSAEFIKPGDKDIQIALKNAGYYTGAIDGDIGPKSTKAIEDFQAANGLTADGKIGRKTWAVLGPYLNTVPASAVKPEQQ